MSTISVSEELLKCLEDNAQSLSEMNLQMQSLYETVKLAKDSKDKRQLMQVYKQMYDAYGRNVESFEAIIKEIRKQVKDA